MVILEDPPLRPTMASVDMRLQRTGFQQQVDHLQSLSDAEILAMGRQSSPDWHEDEFPAWLLGKRQVDPAAMPAFAVPWQHALARIAVPTLLIGGEPGLGSLVSSAAAAEAMALNPLIRLVRVPHAGHNVRRENFPDYLAAVLQFLHGA